MKKSKLCILPVALMVTAGLAIASQPSGANNSNRASSSGPHTVKASLHHESGKVSSLAGNELTLDHTWKGKAEKTKFTLNADTKKEGNIAQGDSVTVYYHFAKGHRVATELKALGANSKAETKKS